MTIRDAKLTDAPRLLEIYAWYVENTAVSFEYHAPSLEAFTGRMVRTMARYPWLVLEEDGRVMGYAYAGPLKDRAAYDWACETTVYVDRVARGRGMGRALYEALMDELSAMGVLNLYACIALPEREDQYLTQDSPRFHARMGFVQAGRFRRCGYKFDRWYDMIWMEKFIGKHTSPQPPVRPWRGAERAT